MLHGLIAMHGLVKPNPSYGYEINNLFLDFNNDYNLEQLIHEPTRDKNILDLVFSSHPAFISHVSIIPGISNHDAVLFDFNLKEISFLSSNYNVYLYHKGDYDGIKSYMNAFSESFLSSNPYNNSVEQNWLSFKVAIQEAINKYIPQRQNNSSRHTYSMD